MSRWTAEERTDMEFERERKGDRPRTKTKVPMRRNEEEAVIFLPP